MTDIKKTENGELSKDFEKADKLPPAPQTSHSGRYVQFFDNDGQPTINLDTETGLEYTEDGDVYEPTW